MIKTLDSTVILAFDKEIICINLLKIVSERYRTCISPEVDIECGSTPRINEFKKHATAFSGDIIKTDEACQYLYKKYNRRLGPGESSSIVASILLKQKGIDNYLVTDDKFAREVAEKIHNDAYIENILGPNVQKIKYTGTIGLILHLKNYGDISAEMMNNIANELENGSFRVTPELLQRLRN